MRATTMYFGAALHTPRGGQCPSLLRLKEGAEGREGWRELGRRRKGALRGREREREREAGWQGGGHRRGVEKNEQTSSKRWRGRVTEERPGAHSLSSLPFFLSRSLLSFSLPLLFLFSLSSPPLLSLSLCPSFFLDCPSVSLYDAPLAATAGFLLPERFPLNVKTRSSAAGSLLSLPFPASLSLRDLFRERACL